MAKVYVTRCIVKKDGKQYKKGSVIEGLSEKEIEQGLSQKWLLSVGHNNDSDDSDELDAFKEDKKESKRKGPSKKKEAEQKEAEQQGGSVLDQMSKEDLMLKAIELNIEVNDTMTEAEIIALITKAEQA